jgi:hypothetical protein
MLERHYPTHRFRGVEIVLTMSLAFDHEKADGIGPPRQEFDTIKTERKSTLSKLRRWHRLECGKGLEEGPGSSEIQG